MMPSLFARGLPPLVSLILLLCCCVSPAQSEEVTSFKSRPDLFAPTLHIEINDPRKVGPGYFLVGPYETATNPGPYIYDNYGNLVWSGWGNSGPGNAHGLHVCRYKGEDHLCFFQGSQQKGYCRGHGVIMDKQYRIVRSVQPGGGMASSDMHEFKLINDGRSALMTVYQQRQFDMSPWNIKAGMGWVMESVFQEVDVETGRVLFEWRSLDHVDPSLSYTYPGHTDTSGTGLDPSSPWDYFHINSIDKNKDGDYLISSRHTSAVYKISHKDGSIMWRLHGAKPSFKNINFSFSQQHDARWLFENTTHSMLSLYNNGYNGYNKTHSQSSGMLLMLNHVNHTAEQVREYVAPGSKGLLSSSQGNMQMLPNRHVVMGWGNNAYISEYDAHGTLVLWGYFSKEPGFMNYRTLKFQWDGNPTDVPALWTYAQTPSPSSPTTFYISWNGATRVQSWRFYGAQNATGPFVRLTNETTKAGFETSYTHSHFYPWTYAEALDADGKVLSKSPHTYTFVPSPELQPYCDTLSCGNAESYGYPGEVRSQASIPPVDVSTVPWIDPSHPEKLFDWGQSGSQYAQVSASETSGLRAYYVHIATAGGVLVLAAISITLIVRVCRKGRRLSRSRRSLRNPKPHQDDSDSEAEDGDDSDDSALTSLEGEVVVEPKQPDTPERRRPWWHPQRYAPQNQETYQPLEA